MNCKACTTRRNNKIDPILLISPIHDTPLNIKHLISNNLRVDHLPFPSSLLLKDVLQDPT